MKLLSVDLGKKMAYAIWENRHPVKFDNVNLDHHNFDDRLLQFVKLIEVLIINHEINHIVCESCAGGGGWIGQAQLNEYKGALKTVGFSFGIRVSEIHQSTVKKLVSGSGRAGKKEVKEAVNKKFGMNIKNADVADAVAIGYAYILKKEGEYEE